MSQKIIDLVTAVVAPAIPEPYELVDIEYEKLGGDYVLSVLIDKPGGITVEDTADLTEIISPLLDTIQPDPFPDQYMLEVSSPGLERPLKTKEALTNAVGQYRCPRADRFGDVRIVRNPCERRGLFGVWQSRSGDLPEPGQRPDSAAEFRRIGRPAAGDGMEPVG